MALFFGILLGGTTKSAMYSSEHGEGIWSDQSYSVLGLSSEGRVAFQYTVYNTNWLALWENVDMEERVSRKSSSQFSCVATEQ